MCMTDFAMNQGQTAGIQADIERSMNMQIGNMQVTSSCLRIMAEAQDRMATDQDRIARSAMRTVTRIRPDNTVYTESVEDTAARAAATSSATAHRAFARALRQKAASIGNGIVSLQEAMVRVKIMFNSIVDETIRTDQHHAARLNEITAWMQRKEQPPIAIYHCSIKIFSRGKGKSAVAAAAYRAAEKIQNQYDGKTYDYTNKKGVVFSEISLPDHAPTEYADRAILWNAVEQIEKASNSQLARETQLALPVELTREQNISLIREYVNQHFVTKGMCADVAIHDIGEGNPHAHIILTMRPIEQDGTWGVKSKKEYILDRHGEKILLKSGEFKSRKISVNDWNEQTKAEEWRKAWANSVNAALEKQKAYSFHAARGLHPLILLRFGT